MKNIKRKEEGVSPVIATILMVAITVVLAATLYMMLPSGGGGDSPLSASLTYNSGKSNPSDGEATFDLSMSDPDTADLDDVKITVLDDTGDNSDSVSGDEWDDDKGSIDIDGDNDFTVSITHLSSETGELSGGDRIRISPEDDPYEGDGISGFEVVLSIDGYDGSRSAVVG
ncbi:MAG: archaellin/type IV pilin N-terminal domain-containing protein [Thermoplasmata archaeon]